MFNETFNKILEMVATTPYRTVPLTQGPNVNWQGASPTGLKGDVLSPPNTKILVIPKKRKKRLKR